MPSYCCVVGCKNGCRGLAQASRDEIANVRKLSSVPIGEQMIPKKITYHHPPKDEGLFKLWSESIVMKKGSKLTASSWVCGDHFVEHDIIKHDEIIIGGKTIRNPRTNWKLRKGVVPCVFEGMYFLNVFS